jgi:hypothetical protein
MPSPWKNLRDIVALYVFLGIVGDFYPSERRILGSPFTVDLLVFLFVWFAILTLDKLDQLINAIKQGNKDNNTD